tara:strand:+ start:480 stop:668 length:189 start_codon:yes stop_codon:yes gene_type:complete
MVNLCTLSLSHQQTNKLLIMTNEQKIIEQMEQALRNINFFVGGLTDEGIEYYYNKMKDAGKL